LLLIIGAVISGILIPYFTRQWQDHQKDLELKTDLVSGISKAIVDLMLAAQLIETKTSPIITNQSYDLAYHNWAESSAIIESQLYAYFPSTHIGQQWNNYSRIVDFSYLLIQM
jgi:hypothetical protein